VILATSAARAAHGVQIPVLTSPSPSSISAHRRSSAGAGCRTPGRSPWASRAGATPRSPAWSWRRSSSSSTTSPSGSCSWPTRPAGQVLVAAAQALRL